MCLYVCLSVLEHISLRSDIELKGSASRASTRGDSPGALPIRDALMSTTALFSGMGLETPAGWRPLFVESPEYQGNVIPNHHHHRKVRVANEGRRVVAPSCPRSTARLQRSPVGRRVESFRSWSSQLFRGRPGGRRHVRSGGRLSDTLMWS